MRRQNHRESKRHVCLESASASQAGMSVAIPQSKFEHLKKVLRIESGQDIFVSDGRGRLFDATFVAQGGRGFAELKGLARTDAEPRETVLVLGFPKNNTMDWCLEKAVECGVTRVIPVVTSRSVVKPDPGELEKYSRRWSLIVESALEQSERTWGASVAPPMDWGAFLAAAKEKKVASVQVACFSEGRGRLSDPERELAGFWEKLGLGASASTAVFIGPEGGFSEAERKDLVEAGFEAASLGREVLRVETAVIAALWSIRLRRSVCGSMGTGVKV